MTTQKMNKPLKSQQLSDFDVEKHEQQVIVSALKQDLNAFKNENQMLLSEIQSLQDANAILQRQLVELETEDLIQDQIEKLSSDEYAQYHQLFELSPIPILVIDQHANIEHLNLAAIAFLFTKKSSALKQNLRLALQEESSHYLLTLLKKLNSQQESSWHDVQSLENRLLENRRGDLFNLQIQRLPFAQSEQHKHYCLHLYPLNLKQTNNFSSYLYRTLFDQIRDGMMITNADKQILKVNTAFSEITGFREDEVIGLTPNILSSGRHSVSFYDAMWQDINAKGYWSGEVWNRRKNGQIFPEWLQISRLDDNVSGKNFYVALFSDITARKDSQQKLDRLAFYDNLTGLPNRALFTQFMEAQLNRFDKSGSSVLAVMFVDLDKFKEVNDNYGHSEGDRVLREATQRIISLIRESDMACRLGGDEFVLALPRLPNEQAVEPIVGKLLRALAEPFHGINHKHRLSASIGVAFYPQHGNSVEELMRRADTAMYRAKANGRNAFQVFHEQDEEELKLTNLKSKMIWRAIEQPNKAIEMHYQPIFLSGDDKTPLKYEALIRLRDKEGKLVYPGDFIEYAEQNGLISQLSIAMFEKVCDDVKAFDLSPNIRVGINLSAVQFDNPKLVDELSNIAESKSLPLSRFAFEVTETATMQNLNAAVMILDQLKQKGCDILLDDFGTGYASLSILKNLPVDVIKIDRGFVFELETSAETQKLIAAMVAMAKALKLRVLTEGVETEKQKDWLENIGVDLLQGYFLGKPQPFG